MNTQYDTPKFHRNEIYITVGVAKRNLRKKNNNNYNNIQ
jgi:hypothetical protein